MKYKTAVKEIELTPCIGYNTKNVKKSVTVKPSTHIRSFVKNFAVDFASCTFVSIWRGLKHLWSSLSEYQSSILLDLHAEKGMWCLCHSKINNASTNLFVLSKHVILYSLQDPTELSKFNLADFYHLKKGLKVLDEGNKTTLNDHY